MKMKQFKVGKSYSMRSACDHDCIWTYTVTKRTASTVTIKDKNGNITNCRINKKVSEYRNAESIFPMGKYSMCPILSAE